MKANSYKLVKGDSKFVTQATSFEARARNIEIFVFSKIIQQL